MRFYITCSISCSISFLIRFDSLEEKSSIFVRKSGGEENQLVSNSILKFMRYPTDRANKRE
jgi:hypothetical protein